MYLSNRRVEFFGICTYRYSIQGEFTRCLNNYGTDAGKTKRLAFLELSTLPGDSWLIRFIFRDNESKRREEELRGT